MWFQKAPIFRFALMFTTGVIFYFSLPAQIPLNHLFLTISIFLCLALLSIRFRKPSGIIWLTTPVVLGFFIAFLHDDKNADNFIRRTINEKEAFLQIRIEEEPVRKNNYVRASCAILKQIRKNSTFQTCGNAMIYFKNVETNTLQYGDVFTGKFRLFSTDTLKQNPYTFDYNRYLKNKGIEYLSFAKYNKLIYEGNFPPNYLKHFALKIKVVFLKIISRFNASEKAKALISALVTGDKTDLDEETVKSFSTAGITHILAVSGLHVGIIYMVFGFLLSFLKKIKFYTSIRMIILLTVLWIYAAVTGFSPSVTRASLMFSVIVIGESLNRQSYIYNSIALSALILLIFNPYNIFEVGFQLSYAAVLGIVSLQPKIANLFRISNKIGKYLWELTAVSIAAQIATFPLSLYYFHQFPMYFMFSNLLAIPLATALLYFSLISLISYPLPFLFTPISFVTGKLADALIFLSQKTMYLPYALLKGIYISIYETVLIYLIILLSGSYIIFRKKMYLYASLTGFVIFYGINIFNDFSKLNQSKILVFNIKRNSVIELINGTQAVRLFLKEIKEKELEFQILPTEQALGISAKEFRFETDFETSFAKKSGNVIQFKNKILYLYNDKNADYPSHFIDYLIVSKNTPLYNIIEKIHPHTRVIFDSSNSTRFVKYWTKKLSGRAILARPDTSHLLEIDC
ncbi:MAG: ComEC family competence protein [Bacteroidetes bacterium]|nr:MAG: ComEC family competence protein [Bacteroidota bacterium]